jgi:hypothetical protein
MEFEPVALRCRMCRCPFVVGVGELQFLQRKALELPTRCPSCRAARRAGRNAPLRDVERDRRIAAYAREHRIGRAEAARELYGD